MVIDDVIVPTEVPVVDGAEVEDGVDMVSLPLDGEVEEAADVESTDVV